MPKFKFHGVGCAPSEQLERNMAYCRGLNIPAVRPAETMRLAVVGGGHSLKESLDELRDFDGDIWIAASAYNFCKSQGIDGWFFAIGPEPHIAEMVGDAHKAVLSSQVDPKVFDKFSGCPIRVLELISNAEDQTHGASTVTAAFFYGIQAGYREITFYGCDSYYPEGEDSHAYEDDPNPLCMNVVCNGQSWHTNPLLLMQAEYMATMIRLAPQVFKEKSGGLLRAMVAEPEYDITHGTPELHELLRKAA